MASLQNKIDPNAEAPGDFEVFDAGNYPMELVESDIKATSAGTGELLTYKIRITDGELKERLIFGQLNLTNPNAIATKIGQGEFLAMRTVIGVLEPEDTDELHFREFIGVVKVTPPKLKKGSTTDYYSAKNEVDWGKTLKLFNGEEVAPVAANDNVPKAQVAAKAAPAKPAPATRRASWPPKAA